MNTKSTSLLLAVVTVAATLAPAFAAKTETAPANKPAKAVASKKKIVVNKKKAAPSAVSTKKAAK